MKIKLYKPKKTTSKSWNEVFNHPKPVKIVSLQTGTVIINKRGTLNPEHPHAGNIPDEELKVPLVAHWVHHAQLGDYLLDAGLDASYHQDPKGGLQGSGVDEFYQDKNENIAYQVAQRGIQLKGVFLSHLHADHAAGVRELPSEIFYAAGKGEWEGYNQEISGSFLEGLETIHIIDFSHAKDMEPLGPGVDLLGDGSLWAVHTPGHTPGHMSFLVNGMSKPTLLTMDIAFIQENIERGVAPSDYTWDVDKAQETLEKIITFLKEYPQVRVWVGHECPTI